MRRVRPRALGLALVVPIALAGAGAGCGGDDGDISQEAVGDALADAGLDDGGGLGSDSGGSDAPPFEANVGGLDVCALLDTAEVEAALARLGPVAPDEAGSGGGQCRWQLGSVTSGSGYVTLAHEPLEGEGPEATYATAVPDDAEAVDGVGDEAAIAPSPNGMRWTMAFVTGPWVMTITTDSSLMTAAEREGVISLAQAVAGRL